MNTGTTIPDELSISDHQPLVKSNLMKVWLQISLYIRFVFIKKNKDNQSLVTQDHNTLSFIKHELI